ncbi:11 kDa late embryogenesis abundant protein-like [Triticum dicoccoides]|uniref:11 kDa late embryogenesis abundant protein-like n=1 Tax=Triticum dicoccoides TaxID=85692 RepID=UPI000E78E7A6|nr:11 kDa late embryogenesis abundant protein-like [Triticum dicoccoides]
MESGKEAAANAGASARAGMEKTRAAVQGQVDKAAAYTTGHREAAVVNKEAAEVKKQQRIRAAEEEKQRAMRDHAAAKERASGEETEDRNGGHSPAPAGGHGE